MGIKLLANGKLANKINIKVNKASKRATQEISKIKGNLVIEDLNIKNIPIEKKSKKKEN